MRLATSAALPVENDFWKVDRTTPGPHVTARGPLPASLEAPNWLQLALWVRAESAKCARRKQEKLRLPAGWDALDPNAWEDHRH